MPSLAQIRRDTQRFAERAATVDVTFTDLNSNSVTVKAKAPEHHTSYDADGVPTSALNSHVEVHEQTLIDAGYATRDAKNRISLKNHLVEYSDINGVTVNYVIRMVQPDNLIGILVCELSYFEA